MILVTIERIDANTRERSILHKLTIANNGSQSDGTGDSVYGSYDVELFDGQRAVIAQAQVHNHERHQRNEVLRLTDRAIQVLEAGMR